MFTRKTNMITTFRIITAIAVFAVTVFFVFTVAFGVHSDEKAEQFLNSPSAIEKFNKAKAQEPAHIDDRISPLVKQAEAFARYLNPPPKPQPRPAAPRQAAGRPKPLGPVSNKFDLIGTSYYELRPELSLALIDEPGKGLRWVRQSAEVGHLIIDRIKDGLVVVRDGKRTFELLPKRPKKTSLVKHGTPPNIPGKTTRHPPLLSEMSDQDQEEFMAQEKQRTKEMLAEIEAMLITPEEVRTLGRLGRKLQDGHQDPNYVGLHDGESDTNSTDPTNLEQQ